MLRFRDLGVFVFEFWVLRFRVLGASFSRSWGLRFRSRVLRFRDRVLRFRSRGLRFRDLGASCFDLRFRVLRFRNYRCVSAVITLFRTVSIRLFCKREPSVLFYNESGFIISAYNLTLWFAITAFSS